MTFTEKEIYQGWSKGTAVIYQDKPYSVHKMSYGDYLIEPRRGNWQSRGERDPFLRGTISLKKTDKGFVPDFEITT